MKNLIPALLLFFCINCINQLYCQTRFNHILITNDDGKEDSKRLLALAMSVKDIANRVSIIVSDFDRSGSSNHAAYGKYQSSFEVTCKYVDKENNITGYTMPDYPADCVLLGLSGFFGDDRPDLVLSGINSGPNIGPDWFGSGTIGAARMSAYLGVKAIAFSGFNDDNKESFSVIPGWIKEFISSGFIDEMGKNSYLTVGFPRIPFKEIKGVRLSERRISFDQPELIGLNKISGKEPHVIDSKSIWQLKCEANLNNNDIKYDDSYLDENFIVITPMTINENDHTFLKKLEQKTNRIPEFIK
jgi:5'-nucleotidase